MCWTAMPTHILTTKQARVRAGRGTQKYATP